MAVEACTASRRKCCCSGAQSKAEHPESREATPVGACRHPLSAGTAGASLAVEIFISRSRSSSSAPATANNTRLAFIATQATMEIREGMELAFWRTALGFFFTIYLFTGPSQSAFKAAKQFLTYMYLISAGDRELCTEDKPHSFQLCTACRMHWWPMQGEAGRGQKQHCQGPSTFGIARIKAVKWFAQGDAVSARNWIQILWVTAQCLNQLTMFPSIWLYKIIWPDLLAKSYDSEFSHYKKSMT